jgi:hypothetical protein
MKFIIGFALAFATLASAMPQGGPGIGHGHGPVHYDEGPALYRYEYAVKDDYSHANYGHGEHRDGHITEGSYFVSLPDGRLQTVHYTVNGDEGYVAEVTYQGEAHFGPGHGGIGGRGVGGSGIAGPGLIGGRGLGGPGLIGGRGLGGPGIGR